MSKIPLAYEASAMFIAKIINHCFEEGDLVSFEKMALLHPLLSHYKFCTRLSRSNDTSFMLIAMKEPHCFHQREEVVDPALLVQ